MQLVTDLSAQLCGAHRAFATRIADLSLAASIDPHARPEAGDLCIARITRLGQHRHIELVSGRRAALAVGDEVIVAFGNRYASDQFEALIPPTLGDCHLVAAGGIASMVVSRHAIMKPPTDIRALGILRDANGVALNLSRWGWPGVATPANAPAQPHMILVAGTSMNAGKTTLCANVIRTLRECGLRASALKLTGTGAGGTGSGRVAPAALAWASCRRTCRTLSPNNSTCRRAKGFSSTTWSAGPWRRRRG